MDFKGIIIEESLKDKSILMEFKIVNTKIEKVTNSHRTPWLSKWTIHKVIISEEKCDEYFERLSKALDDSHEWYIEVENNKYNVLIFHDRIIKKRIYNHDFD